MKLYHGSPVFGIDTLRPARSNHGKPYVYLTDRPTLALLYAHNPLPSPKGWFPYHFDKDGRLFYDEYFPNALEVLYRGQRGVVYTCEAELPGLEKMPWVRLSEAPVPVRVEREVDDLAEALQEEIRQGRLTLCPAETQSPVKVERIVRRELEACRPEDAADAAYIQFLHRHFPHIR